MAPWNLEDGIQDASSLANSKVVARRKSPSSATKPGAVQVYYTRACLFIYV
jgi:hypothetical protein